MTAQRDDVSANDDIDSTMINDDNNAKVDAVEALAGRIVGLGIQALVEHFRIEFPTRITTTTTTIRQKTKAPSSSSSPSSLLLPPSLPPPPSLVTRMVESGLWQQVQSLLLEERRLFSDDKSFVEDPPHSYPQPQQPSRAGDREEPMVIDLHRERTILMLDVVLPLVRALTRCYRVLDRLPSSTTETTAATAAAQPPQQPVSKSEQLLLMRSRAKAKVQPPRPPRGMLSLQHYTDIACLLEFCVCTGILPHLQDGVATCSITDRIRYQLPKSLAGRIPASSLQWGCQIFMTTQKQIGKTFQQRQRRDELVAVATTLADLLILDRFRPMMLPRHLPDVYVALFQAEQYEVLEEKEAGKGHDNSNSSSYCSTIKSVVSTYRELGLSPPFQHEPTLKQPKQSRSRQQTPIEATLQAKTYQTVLLNGTKAPSWLRQRVSPLLTDLACCNLAAIVAVFVPQSGNQSSQSPENLSSSACQRLGKTLATSAGSSMNVGGATIFRQQEQLCQQVLDLLTWTYPDTTRDTLSSHVLAIIQTAWAILDHFPDHVVETCILLVWRERLTVPYRGKKVETVIHATIRQIGSLFAFVPPMQDRRKRHVLKYVLSSMSTLDTTVLGQVLRVATAPGLLVVQSSAREDARRTLQLLTQMAYSVGRKDAKDAVVAAWGDALAPSSWDLDGYKFSWAYNETKQDALEKLVVLKEEAVLPELHLESETSFVFANLTTRATVFVDKIVKVFSADDDNPKTSSDGQDRPFADFPSRIFRWFLRNYLPGDPPTALEDDSCSGQDRRIRRLVSIVLLPLLCEKCTQEQLLFGDGDDGVGLLILIREILSQLVSTRMRINSDVDFARPLEPRTRRGSDHQSLSVLDTVVQSQQEDDTLSSIASIVMSMLITILELGSKARSDQEESLLHNLLPIMNNLARLDNLSGDSSQEGAAMADMASYAMSLIASRQCISEEEPISNDDPPQREGEKTERDKLKRLLEIAANDLESTQPPIRAKGMVSLGRLARGFAGVLPQQRSPLIHQLDQSGNAVDDNDILLLINEVLWLSMIALADKESYVYLAAVQTIVALGDMHPKFVLPIIALGVATGDLALQTSSSTSETTPLSQEQRIKLAEALMFTIRRRAVIDEYIPDIIRLMLHETSLIGEVDNNMAESAGKLYQLTILEATDKYFAGDGYSDIGLDSHEEKRERWAEQDIRLKTGGPVFDTEEVDVIRSIRISVLAELVSHSPPSSTAPHVKILVRLAVEALRLDRSRFVGRAAALLAVAIYKSIFLEAEEMAEAMNQAGSGASRPVRIPFTVALAKSGEAILSTTLEEYDSTEKRVYDAATTARCLEAMTLRRSAHEAGIFLAAELMVHEENKKQQLPTILTSMTEEAKTSTASRIVELDVAKSLE